ncbi:MAG: glycosyltransferase family 4 protein [Granulosicoccus sp.]|nr:glycosyltransferase family 4 protein [Granulosicoccus sp.]
MSSSKSIKVAYVIQRFHPTIGGAEAQLLALLPLMTAQNIEPLVITRGIKGEPSRDVVNKLPVVRCGSYRYGLMGSLGFFLGAMWQLWRFKPEVVHAFSLMTPSTIGSAYRALTGTPLVVKSLRGGIEGDFDRISSKALFEPRRWMLNKSIDAAQVISQEIDDEFEQLGLCTDKRHRIANGVDLRRAHITGSAQDYRAAMSIPENAMVFAFVGRLASEKRVDRLIDAYAQAFSEDPDVWLVIAGTGEKEDSVRKQAASLERVIFLGACDTVAELLKAVNVFVLPSVTEGMSNAMLEAMAAGLPVIGTDVGAASELLGEGEHAGQRGILIAPENTEELRDAMLSLRVRSDLDELGARARKYVVDHHSLQNTGSRLVAIYQQCTERA